MSGGGVGVGVMYSYHAAGMCLCHAFHKLGSGDICHSRECAWCRQRHVDIFEEESTNTKSQKVSQEERRGGEMKLLLHSSL